MNIRALAGFLLDKIRPTGTVLLDGRCAGVERNTTMCTTLESRRAGGRLCGLLVLMSLLGGAPSLALGQNSPDAPERLNVEDVSGNYVTLTWEAPVNETPEAYVVEGGFAPDDVAGSLALGPDTTSVTVPLPSGVYYIRTYAVVDGQRSQPSNEVQVAVAMPTPPAAPDNLAAVAVGNGVAVTWRRNYNGGTPTGVLLDVSGPVGGTIPLGDTGEFRVAGVPNGVYTLQLRAVNGAGASPSTPSVTLSLPGPVPVVTKAPSTSPADPVLPVRYERPAARLDQLRTREQLDAVIAGAASEFEAILKLRDWVSAQFPDGVPDPYPAWDAMVVLDEIRAGRTGGFCAQFSQVLLQSLAALGVPARYIEIGPRDNPMNHFPLEVWSNDFDKWVLVDADFILHYERNGVPLSAAEAHDAYVSGQAGAVTVVEGVRAPGHPSSSYFPERTLELYYYVRYPLKADHVSAPNEAAFDRLNDAIELLDSRTIPWERSPFTSPFVANEVLTRQSTSSPALVDAPINQLWVTPRVSDAAEVTVDLATNMPNVAYAEYRLVNAQGVAGPWRRHYAATFVWRVGSGDRALEIRAVNARDVAGPVSAVSLVTP